MNTLSAFVVAQNADAIERYLLGVEDTLDDTGWDTPPTEPPF
jgi:hypothetical protein